MAVSCRIAKAAGSSNQTGPDWCILSPLGPTVAFHASCVLNNKIYIHGGIDKKGCTDPLNKMWCMDLDTTIWNPISAPNSPALSHHACASLANRYILFIGGWDGKRRTSEVHVFDTEELKWSHPKTVGFPEGAGLSSHTATLGANNDILLIGREGSLRTQRRAGNAFILNGDIKLMKYVTFPLGVESRSGHTAHIIGNNLYVLGGRDDKLIEIHRNFRNGDPVCEIMEKLVKYTDDLNPMIKPPCGRKNHVGASGAGAIFVHGGETFDGRSREPVGEMYLMKTKPTIIWYKLGVSAVARVGHSCSVSSDKIVIHGGMAGKSGTVYGDTYQLEL